jgi:hypothetical protein
VPRRRGVAAKTMVDRIAVALAKADGRTVAKDPTQYHRLGVAALRPVAAPSEAMINPAHQAAWFDAEWAINSRWDFRRAVRAMIIRAIGEGQGSDDGRRPRLP